MLSPSVIRRELAQIVANRLRGMYEPGASGPADSLSFHACISEDAAASLLSGEPVALDESEHLGLSAALFLHPGLLSCLLSPLAPSDEVIRHVLDQVRSANLDPGCEDCAGLAQAIERCSSRELEDWEQLALDLLAHVNKAPEGLESDEDIEQVERLADIVFGLPHDLREEVHAFAIFKRQEAEGRSFSDFSALARFRTVFLSPFARQAFDAIASSARGELTVRELAAELGLPDSRALGQLARSVTKAVSDLDLAGQSLPEEPFTVHGRGSSRSFRLAPRTLNAWRALAQAGAGSEQAVLDGIDWDSPSA